MTRSSVVPLLLLPLSLACATSPAATPARSPSPAAPAAAATAAAAAARATMNPVATYDFSAVTPDGSVNGSFTIVEAAGGGYSGTIQRQGTNAIALDTIAVNGQTLTLGASTPDGPVTLTLTFTGAEFSGRWVLEGESGAITGRRR